MTNILPTFFPERRLLRSEDEPVLDTHGFLDETYAENLPSFADLLDLQAVLILAPPWYGKTTTAKQLEHHFREEASKRGSAIPFGRFFHFTSFDEDRISADADPGWWNEWQQGEERACWIIDAVDQDYRQGTRRTNQIVRRIEELDKGTRSRLLLMVFARTDEMPAEVREKLENIYSPEEPQGSKGLQVLKLAPPDRSLARVIAGNDDESFQKVCRTIERNNLEQLAAFPAAILALKSFDENTAISAEEVWRGVLRHLLLRSGLDESLLEEAFMALGTMTAVLSFSDASEISEVIGGSRGPCVDDVFPRRRDQFQALRGAARMAIKTAVFQRTGTGFQFAQSHVQEWFTAFAVRGFPLTRFRPLVTDNNGTPLNIYNGLFGILCKILPEKNEVRRWIVESHGGIAPRSDAAPWSLHDAVAALGHLQSLAKEAKYGLPELARESLKRLKHPGIGDEIAKRLGDKTLTLGERDFLLDAAVAVTAGEAVPVAVDIVCDENEDDSLRLSATVLLQDLGWVEHFERLDQAVRCMQKTSQMKKRIQSSLVHEFYVHKYWSFEKTVEYIPEPGDEDVIDMTYLLEFALEEDLNAARARQILEKADWERVRKEAGEKHKHGPGLYRGTARLVMKALDVLNQQDQWSEEDERILLNVLLTLRGERWADHFWYDLLHRLGRARDVRRSLCLKDLDEGEQGTRRDRLSVWYHMDLGDLDWVLELHRGGKKIPRDILVEILSLAYRNKAPCPKIGKVRCIIKHECGANFLAKADSERKDHEDLLRKHNLDNQRRQESPRRYSLHEVIEDCLSREGAPLLRRFHDIACVCFTGDHMRPTNIDGVWDDLGDDLKQKCLSLCEKALQECEPTDIPVGDSFSSVILCEAAAFNRVALASKTFALEAAVIGKWLPATLRLYNMTGIRSDSESVLLACLDADRQITEDLIVKELRREMCAEEGTALLALRLPETAWSERFKKLTAILVEEKDLFGAARCELLRTLAGHAPGYVRTIAEKWSERDPSTDSAMEEMLTAGLDALLVIDPELALPRVVACFDQSGAKFLTKLKSLGERNGSSFADASAWPSHSLKELADVLHRAFPVENDPEDKSLEVTWVGPEDRLRDLREAIPRRLFERDSQDATNVLQDLANSYPNVKRWYDYSRAHREATGFLRWVTPSGEPTKDEAGRVPVDDLIRALGDETDYRLIRNSDDLLRVLIEELDAIGKDAKKHLPVLYHPSENGERKRLREEALQAYVFCRLNDRLPGRVLNRDTKTVFLNREPLEARNERDDIKVETIAIDRKPATVIIEIKWSDNRDISTSLKEQLGQKYLVDGNHTHGIYLVGWCGPGRWKGSAGAKPKPRDSMEAWKAAFQKQAEEFRKEHTNNPNNVIRPFVMDLQWQ